MYVFHQKPKVRLSADAFRLPGLGMSSPSASKRPLYVVVIWAI